MSETIQTIISFQLKKYHGVTPEKVLDIFTESVENYKRAPKRQKLKCAAQAFIDACLVLGNDYLTGAQALEVFNNLATDLETDKDSLTRQINKLMKQLRKEYEKNSGNRTWLNLIRVCFRKTRK